MSSFSGRRRSGLFIRGHKTSVRLGDSRGAAFTPWTPTKAICSPSSQEHARIDFMAATDDSWKVAVKGEMFGFNHGWMKEPRRLIRAGPGIKSS